MIAPEFLFFPHAEFIVGLFFVRVLTYSNVPFGIAASTGR